MTVADGIVRLLNEAYLRMTDNGAYAAESDYSGQTVAYVLIAIERLTELDDQVAYETIAACDPGAQRLVAAQAIAELRTLGFHVQVEDPEDED